MIIGTMLSISISPRTYLYDIHILHVLLSASYCYKKITEQNQWGPLYYHKNNCSWHFTNSKNLRFKHV